LLAVQFLVRALLRVPVAFFLRLGPTKALPICVGLDAPFAALLFLSRSPKIDDFRHWIGLKIRLPPGLMMR
jgi:hypothetical protein